MLHAGLMGVGSTQATSALYTNPGFLATVAAAVSLTLISIYTVFYVRRHGFDSVLLWLTATLVAGLWWSSTQAVKLAVQPESTTVLMHKIQHPAIASLPVLFLLFALVYTDHGGYVTRRNVALLALPGAVVLVLGLTNFRFHSLAWTGYTFIEHRGATSIEPEFGVGMIAYLSYAYVLVLVGIYYFFQMILESDSIYRGQAAAITLGVLTPLTLNFLYHLDFYFVLDPTAVGFSVSVACLAFAIYRYRLLDLVPVARENIIEKMEDPYLVVDDHGRVVDLNPAARDSFELDDVVGTMLETAVPELQGVLTDDEDSEIEVDGRYYTVSHSTTEVHGARDPATLLLLRDITEVHRVEKRYQHLIENSSDLITILDRDGTVQYVSPSAEHIVGFQDDDIVDVNVFEVSIHPEDRERVEEIFQNLLENPGEEARFEHRLATDDGWIHVETKCQNLLDDPFVGGVVTNSRDVTERKERERQLRQANERLDRFASVVSHDLRNPLTVAQGYLELADERDDALEKVADAHSRMERLIDDALAMAREEEPELTSLYLEDVAVKAWRNVETRDATLEVSEDRKLEADRDKLIRIMENLYRNSVEHGGGDVEVTVQATDSGFQVEDDGPGFPDPEAVLTGEPDGGGLGLQIVEDLAESHGWQVEASNDDGARVEFTF